MRTCCLSRIATWCVAVVVSGILPGVGAGADVVALPGTKPLTTPGDITSNLVDGVDNNDPIVGAVRATFSQEAIQEFQVRKNSTACPCGSFVPERVMMLTTPPDALPNSAEYELVRT